MFQASKTSFSYKSSIEDYTDGGRERRLISGGKKKKYLYLIW